MCFDTFSMECRVFDFQIISGNSQCAYEANGFSNDVIKINANYTVLEIKDLP